jgi:hypothetical protein
VEVAETATKVAALKAPAREKGRERQRAMAVAAVTAKGTEETRKGAAAMETTARAIIRNPVSLQPIP